jgi:N-acetylmuramoyl-L-alanine amidase
MLHLQKNDNEQSGAMKNKIWPLFFFLFSCFQLYSLDISIRSYDHQGFTRLVFEGSGSFQFKTSRSASNLKLELDRKAHTDEDVTLIHDSALLDKVVHVHERNRSVFVVFSRADFEIKRDFVLERPFRVVFDLAKSEQPAITGSSVLSVDQLAPADDSRQPEGQEADRDFGPNKNQKKTSIETICIDPGHGGSDFGAMGRSDLKEKDITLKVAKKLKSLIESRLGLRVISTREIDSEVSLNSRVSIANNQKADMFISIHVNSSFRKGARGPETFFVSLKATDQAASDLAQQENKSFDEIDKSAETEDLKMILWDMAQSEYIRESSKLAEFIQNELNIILNTVNRGVKQAPFRVLMRAAMPAVLVEIAFISNPSEEQKLRDDQFLQKVSQSIYDGISKFIYYFNSMNR